MLYLTENIAEIFIKFQNWFHSGLHKVEVVNEIDQTKLPYPLHHRRGYPSKTEFYGVSMRIYILGGNPLLNKIIH